MTRSAARTPAACEIRFWCVMSIPISPPGSIMYITMKIAMIAISVPIIMICNTPRNSVCIARNIPPIAACENSSASADRTIEEVVKTTTPNQMAATPKRPTKIG